MRSIGGIILILLIFSACKTTQVNQSVVDYEEDLTKLRPRLELNQVEQQTVANTSVTRFDESKSLKNELDSINTLIVSKNRERKFVDGYTIQIYTGNDRVAAEETQAKARALFQDLTPKVSYYQPTYKVKVGQYTDRLDAHYMFEQIKKQFPLALLIPERILVDYD